MAQAAQNDLRDKLALERELVAEITVYFASVVRAFIVSRNQGRDLNLTAGFSDALAEIFINHYERVQNIFAFRIRDVMPKEISATEKEEQLIERALAHYRRVRSVIQASSINKTARDDILGAMQSASTFDGNTQQIVDGVVSKKGLIGFELILVASQILNRKLKSRIKTISITETQTTSEAAKLTETEVLSGARPTVLGGGTKKIKVTKIWVTVGDSNVRDTHLEADGQERESTKPFNVGSSQLMVPGDSSLGAPAGETINCRCAAVFNETDVFAIRFDTILEETFLERG